MVKLDESNDLECHEHCLPLFCMERDEDKLKAQVFSLMSMANRGTVALMTSSGGFPSNEIPNTFIV